jgi:hypothetical protein
MENSFAPLIDSATSILILLPERPGLDETAAGLSLYLSLMNAKSTTISCPSPMTVGLNRLIGVQKISSELGNKNLTIKFKNYDANNIEKVSYDIVNNEFNLTIVPKNGLISPNQDQMEVGFSGISADLILLIGGKNDTDFPSLQKEELKSAKIAHIGNRVLSATREIMSFATSGSTVSEVIARVIKDNNLAEIDPDIATNLVTGIEDGSSNFASPDVTPDTFEIFAYLLRSGGRRGSRVKLSPMGFPPGSIPTQPFNVPTAPQINQTVAVPTVPMEQPERNDFEGTSETEQDINPPDDWLQPKVYKGSNQPPQQGPSSFSENKG